MLLTVILLIGKHSVSVCTYQREDYLRYSAYTLVHMLCHVYLMFVGIIDMIAC